MPVNGINPYLLLSLAAIFLYLTAGVAVWRRLGSGQPWSRGAKALVRGIGFAALALHTRLLYHTLYHARLLSLGLSNVTSLVAWAVALIFLLTSLRKPIENLAIFIMPTAAASIVLQWEWPSRPTKTTASVWLFAHLVVSILAYSLLSIAVVQAMMLAIQERRLHGKHAGRSLRMLPPLQTMETLMFQMLAIGFALLTLTLVSGLFFSEQLFGRPLVWSHHIVLAFFAWVVFAILLIGRWRFGWRGQQAVRWTFAGFVLLLFAYLGTQFVLEVTLARHSPGHPPLTRSH
ncbi:MAG TPA: cytochrome c biogenesis protein CcsA [Acidiferrobacteraceae bacterium]|nr:cytochrome c biogenesis protein CcsA [Acidiferrobacteraceae bacterium]